jgi:hypothetical protein
MRKDPFEKVFYDRYSSVFGKGNKALCLLPEAVIQLCPQDEREKADWLDAKAIYDRDINKGLRFRPGGEQATRNMLCTITHINVAKQTVSWKQINMSANDRDQGCKPAAGKFSINSMIHLIRNKEILMEQSSTK